MYHPLRTCGVLLTILALLPTQDVTAQTRLPKKSVIQPPPIRTLTITPQQIALSGRYAECRPLVNGVDSSGAQRDLSAMAVLTVSDPKIAVLDSEGTLRPRKDGSAYLIARYSGLVARIPLAVKGITAAAPPRFLADVMPVLTKGGCNMGACHGAGSGKGGFKLSLLGYDPDADYETITRASSARRIARSQPENSLLLLKPTMRVSHRGGLRFKMDSPEYRLMRDWIARGLPGPDPAEAKVVRLEIQPAVRTLSVGQTQRFAVRALYSDGSQRDATGQSVFTASDETVAAVSANGEATVAGPGEGAVLVRYQGLVTTARILSPYASVARTTTGPTPNAQHPTPSVTLDRLVTQKLDALGLKPSSRCSDADFVRRVYLDVIGLLPTPEEARTFLASRAPDKRAKLIDALLQRSEYVDFWSLRWGDLLRSSRQTLTDKGMMTLNHWIRDSVAANKPWDQFAREILLAQGNTYQEGPTNFFRSATTPQELAETTSQAFLGVRIQCAKCHNHPYEKWTQNQYYQMAAFFARVKAKRIDGQPGSVVTLVKTGEVTHPKTRKEMAPCALDAAPVPASYTGDRRQALAEWVTSPKNPFFSRVLVNRLWKHFLGRGFVEPVDDMRVTNPPSNGPLLDWLAQDFSAHGFDLKNLMRTILNSETYQRSSEVTKENSHDLKYCSHYPFKRLGAEQLMDAISTTTNVPDKFAGYPQGTRACQLADTTTDSYFLDLFGRPARTTTCECERTDSPNLSQILHLMNNAGLNTRIASNQGRIALLLDGKAKRPDKAIVEELYLTAYSRYPTADESKRAISALAPAPDRRPMAKGWFVRLTDPFGSRTMASNRRATAEDLLWALMNSKEFLFNH